jgi:hypothetical protein
MGYGKKAARNIDERLMGAHRMAMLSPEFEYDQAVPHHPSESPRHTVTELPPQIRLRDFREAVRGLSAVETMEEACRCLRCDVRESH